MNINQNIKKKIDELVDKINKWNHEYYVLSEPSISDNKYDIELRKLEILEQQYPEFISINSPTKKVGGNIVKGFKEFKHNSPMLSLAKAYSKQDLEKFYNDVIKKISKKVEFSLEPKIDGASISLHYEEGILVRAVTRGTGQIGNDITNNIKEIADVPKIINYKKRLEVRGEVYLPKSQFVLINQKRVLNNEKPFANPRNAASGTIQQLDNSTIKERNLSTIIYNIVDPLEHNIQTQTDAIHKLKTLGFNTSPYIEKSSLFEEIWNYVFKFKELKKSFDFECDGFVLKVNKFDLWNNFGLTAKFPKYAIAYKFETEEAKSIIKNIIPTVGRTGKISYIAEIEPVTLAQTTVRKATLHNSEFIKELNINIGDEIILIKSGEIIPKITGLSKKRSINYYEKIKHCPSCDSILVNLDNLVDQFCLNANCNEKKIRSIIHFTSKKALDINTLGEKNIEIFYKYGFISDLISIFKLKNFKNEILKLRNFQETKINKILDSIEKAKNTQFLNVLYGIGIKHIGHSVAEIIAEKISNFKELININFEELEKVNTIGPSIIYELKEYIKQNKDLLIKFDEIFKYQTHSTKKSHALNNLSFVITGKLNYSRSFYEQKIKENNGRLLKSVNKNLDYLITNEKNTNSSKMIAALKYDIKIINEEQFLQLIKKDEK
ncbi:NAD-dependent DNA ligase LigA [Mycoplasmopsis cynos]|uniref:NAD-dependent DNA ligase LigA n=1 Tax=Mycoplasmopsis cynos TaxID=171284 RepID=UPI002AFE1F4C|nr:NAD-dependent DNA ligase LigA [Mycoplasmopsis cynos]WQQ14562.1 NAD-dependent DNA ligase LigA [Mycoplasmopsis cynos]